MEKHLINLVKELSGRISQDVIETRRYLHQNPELSFQEYQTSSYVAEKLKSYGLSPQQGIAGTGVIALIEGQNPDSKTIALRADMDALPIVEANEVPYKSKNEGIMHACGHDVHTAVLLGVAKVLSELREQFSGTVKLIFQPGEEKVPGGASLMIQKGVLSNPNVQSIIGQHVMPFLPVGKVGFKSGMYMASADEIYMTVLGEGGHAAMPENCIDPVLIASHIIIALQQIVSRIISPKVPAVLSFGKIIGLGATNVIPSEVKIEGTFRCMDEKWRKKAHESIYRITYDTAKAFGGRCEVEIRQGYPFLKNDVQMTERLKQAAADFLGKENVVELDLWMASEDFSYYTQEIPGCFYRLGVRNEQKGVVSGVHTPTFDIDEEALEIGVGLMTWLALNELSVK